MNAKTALESIVNLPERATGLLLFGREASSSVAIAVHERRVCWATATRHPWRLTDIIAIRTGLDRAVTRGAYREARARGVRVGEWLVERGWITRGLLIECLASQARDSIALVTGRMGDPVWVDTPEPPPLDSLDPVDIAAAISLSPGAAIAAR